MSWTDERVETLKTLLAEGKSASQIAKELGGVTRNAVIGKIHRLGLSSRAQAAAAAAEAAKTETPPEPAPPPAPEPRREPLPSVAIKEFPKTVVHLQPKREETAPMGGSAANSSRTPPHPVNETSVDLSEIEKRALKLNLLQLTERTCKWPIGDPNDPDFHFCGLPALASKPYCASHAAAAYQPMSSRRDRERTRAAARLTSMT